MPSLGTQFGVSNVIIPKEGPKTVPQLLDFSNSASVLIDGEQITSTGAISYIQGVYIDNADNADPLSLTMQITGQRVICPAGSQGYFPIMVPNPPRMIAETTQGGSQQFNVIFYNVPMQPIVWKVQ